MRVIQICHRVPYPPIDGGNIVMMNMAVALEKAGNEVFQFALNTKKHFVDPNSIPEVLRKKLNFHSAIIDTKVSAGGMIKSMFTSGSYNISRFYSAGIEKEISALLGKYDFDIVQLETLFCAPYINCIRKNSLAKIILRAHNVEHIIWERLAKAEKNIAKKALLNSLAGKLKKYELKTLKLIDGLVPITPVDERVFREFDYNRPLLTLPMSMDISEYKFDENYKADLSVFHLGSMDWLPNLEAVEWFLKECWPKLHSELPELKLHLAGRNFPEQIMHAGYPSVICEGRIEDAHAYMKNKQIMIVPLHSGSGMRVKIIQGMAHGKTIISTTIGAEGIPAENGKEILIADTSDEFITAVHKCISNPDWCRQIGVNARRFAEGRYSNEAIGKKMSDFYKVLKN